LVVCRKDGSPLSEAEQKLVTEKLADCVLDHNIVAVHVCRVGRIVYAPLTGYYLDDGMLHLGIKNGMTTEIACGDALGLHSTGSGSEPTQHRRWTSDRAAWESAENACPACRALALRVEGA
jgi:hypothetical protein